MNVIHDYGQGGVFIGGNLVADADGVIDGTATGVEYYQIYNANFALKRRGYFHYVVMPHQYLYEDTFWSSGSAQTYAGARRDRINVSLHCQATDRRVGNTIMHELGHNFMLLHGGDNACNRMPNYNSVMNYRYQFIGPDRNCDAEPDIGADYSTGQLADLEESALDEFKGVCGDKPVDWDVSFSLEAQITANLNKYPEEVLECGGEIGVLRDYDDWSSIELDIDAYSGGGGKPTPPAAVCGDVP